MWQEEAFRPDPLAQALASLIASDVDQYLDKFNFRSEICISCDWRRMELGNRVISLGLLGFGVSACLLEEPKSCHGQPGLPKLLYSAPAYQQGQLTICKPHSLAEGRE
jgi:hypothetical protein